MEERSRSDPARLRGLLMRDKDQAHSESTHRRYPGRQGDEALWQTMVQEEQTACAWQWDRPGRERTWAKLGVNEGWSGEEAGAGWQGRVTQGLDGHAEEPRHCPRSRMPVGGCLQKCRVIWLVSPRGFIRQWVGHCDKVSQEEVVYPAVEIGQGRCRVEGSRHAEGVESMGTLGIVQLAFFFFFLLHLHHLGLLVVMLKSGFLHVFFTEEKPWSSWLL